MPKFQNEEELQRFLGKRLGDLVTKVEAVSLDGPKVYCRVWFGSRFILLTVYDDKNPKVKLFKPEGGFEVSEV